MLFKDSSPSLRSFAQRSKTQNQIRVTKNRNVCVMGRKDELPPLFFFANFGHYALCNKAIIEVILWLINY